MNPTKEELEARREERFFATSERKQLGACDACGAENVPCIIFAASASRDGLGVDVCADCLIHAFKDLAFYEGAEWAAAEYET